MFPAGWCSSVKLKVLFLDLVSVFSFWSIWDIWRPDEGGSGGQPETSQPSEGSSCLRLVLWNSLRKWSLCCSGMMFRSAIRFSVFSLSSADLWVQFFLKVLWSCDIITRSRVQSNHLPAAHLIWGGSMNSLFQPMSSGLDLIHVKVLFVCFGLQLSSRPDPLVLCWLWVLLVLPGARCQQQNRSCLSCWRRGPIVSGVGYSPALIQAGGSWSPTEINNLRGKLQHQTQKLQKDKAVSPSGVPKAKFSSSWWKMYCFQTAGWII